MGYKFKMLQRSFMWDTGKSAEKAELVPRRFSPRSQEAVRYVLWCVDEHIFSPEVSGYARRHILPAVSRCTKR